MPDKKILIINYNGEEYQVGSMTEEDKTKLNQIDSFATRTVISATSPIVASASTGSVSLTHATSGPNTTTSTTKGDSSKWRDKWKNRFLFS